MLTAISLSCIHTHCSCCTCLHGESARNHLRAWLICSQVPLLFAGCSKLAVSEDYICSLVDQANRNCTATGLACSASSSCWGSKPSCSPQQCQLLWNRQNSTKVFSVSSLHPAAIPCSVVQYHHFLMACARRFVGLHEAKSVPGRLRKVRVCGASAFMRSCRRCKARRPCKAAQGSAEAPTILERLHIVEGTTRAGAHEIGTDEGQKMSLRCQVRRWCEACPWHASRVIQTITSAESLCPAERQECLAIIHIARQDPDIAGLAISPCTHALQY